MPNMCACVCMCVSTCVCVRVCMCVRACAHKRHPLAAEVTGVWATHRPQKTCVTSSICQRGGWAHGLLFKASHHLPINLTGSQCEAGPSRKTGTTCEGCGDGWRAPYLTLPVGSLQPLGLMRSLPLSVHTFLPTNDKLHKTL